MTTIHLCGQCYLVGYCRRLTSKVVTRGELSSAFIGDVRRFMAAMNLTRDQWLPYLDAAYRDYPGRIVDAAGIEIALDMEVFDRPSLRYWFRDLCRPIPEGVTPRLRREALGRFIVTASILRAVHPVAALLWGREIANDVAPGLMAFPPSRQDECPYRHFTKPL